MTLSRYFLLLAIGCVFAFANPGVASARPRSALPARLIIKRVATFGRNMSINIYIDGNFAGNLGYNRTYESVVPSGVHLVQLDQVPRWGGSYETSEQRIRFTPGETSFFTAVTDDGGKKAVLIRS